MSANVFQAYRLLFTTLGPVHIGSGNEYDPTNYVIDDDSLYEFDPLSVAEALPETERTKLAQLVDQAKGADLLLQVQAFFYRNREALIPAVTHRMPVLSAVAENYRERIGQVAQREQSGRRILNQLEIERTAGNPISREPILLGSSLKGAMRTALLDEINEGRPLQHPQEKNQDLQKRLFRYQNPNNSRGMALELDPLRLIQLKDACYDPNSGHFGTEVRFAVNRKKHPVLKDGKLVRSQAQNQNLRQVLECVPPLRYRAFEGELLRQDPSQIRSPKLPAEDLRWTMADLATACNRFYRRRFEIEIRQLRERGYLDGAWSQTVDSLLASFDSKLQGNRAFLLRVGRHSGAESVTLEGVRNIKILEGKDPDTGKQRFSYQSESKTWWLAAPEIQAEKELLPFGWLLVEWCPLEQDLTEDPQAKNLSARFNPEASAWVRRSDARVRALRVETERRQAEERARREAAEREARERADQEARQAAMSDEDRAIQALRDLFAEAKGLNRRNPGEALGQRFNSVAEEAKAWPFPARAELVGLLREINKFLDGDQKKRRGKIEAIPQ